MRRLGQISIPAGASRSNASTAAPFDLPKHDCMLAFDPSATGLTVAFKASAAATDFALTADGKILPWRGKDAGVVSIWNTTGGTLTCEVFATDMPGIVLTL